MLHVFNPSKQKNMKFYRRKSMVKRVSLFPESSILRESLKGCTNKKEGRIMKKSLFVFVAVAILGIALVTADSSYARQWVRIPYLAHGGGWFTGITIINFDYDDIESLKVDFLSNDGTFALVGRDLGELRGYELKIYSLADLYGGTLPDTAFWLCIYH